MALVLAVVLAAVPPRQDAAAQVPPPPAGTISGFVFGDQNRNGIFDDGESRLGNVPVTLTPAGSSTPIRTGATNSLGQYLFNGLAPGTYSIAVVPPNGATPTTPNPRSVVLTAGVGQGGVNFGLALSTTTTPTRTPSGNARIFGVVFEDEDGDGDRDSGEDGIDDVEVRLERINGGDDNDNDNNDDSDRTDSEGRYSFENLEPGDYEVEARRSGYRAMTRNVDDLDPGERERRDIGLMRTADATATARATTTAVARATSESRSGPTAVAAIAATTVAGILSTPSAARTSATPNARRLAARRLNGLVPRLTRFKMRSVTYLGGGNRVDAAADGAIIPPDRLSMRIVRNEHLQEVVVIGQQAYVKGPETNDQWTSTSYAALRAEIELLAPLDALRALKFIEAADEGGEVIVEGVPTTYYVGDVNTLALWEEARKENASSGQAAPVGVAGPRQTGAGPTGTPQPEQVAREMRIHAWVGQEDRIIRAERMTANVLAPITDPSQIPDSVVFDAEFVFSEPDRPFAIAAPAIPTATPVPTLAPTAAAAAQAPSTAVPAPAPGAPGTPTRTPAPLPGVVPEGTPLPGEEEPTDETGAPIELPPGTMPTQREQELAAERALVAIVSGGQCRPGSLALPPLIQLDAPFRTQQDGTVYSPTNSSTASLAMVLGAYGVEVALVDLRALLNGLEGTYSPSSTPRIETVARVAERAGLNVVDLHRGTRFNEWTVEGVREMIRRGYPTITLVQGAVLPGGTPPGVARERFITIVGMDGDALIYHDPAYPDEGTGATRRVNARQLEQAWLAASTARLAAAFSLGPEGRGLLECGRVSGTPGTPEAVATSAPGVAATATPVVTLAPTPEPPAPEYPFGLPIHPLLLAFLLLLLVLLILVLVRFLR